MRSKHFLVFLFIIPFSLIAQKNAIIKFDKDVYDFGKINEEKGTVSTTFFFQNTGTDTLTISEVKPTCSCTIANWSKAPLSPEGKGFVTVDFDPLHKSGDFSKAIYVRSNATVPNYMLTIKGVVIPRAKTIYDTFPMKIGNLLLKSSYIVFNKIMSNQIKSDTLEVYNFWNKPMTFTTSALPTYVEFESLPKTLEPHKSGKFIITYNAIKKNDFGICSDNIVINSNDSLESNKRLIVNADIKEDF